MADKSDQCAGDIFGQPTMTLTSWFFTIFVNIVNFVVLISVF